jgi:hypothetical protein
MQRPAPLSQRSRSHEEGVASVPMSPHEHFGANADRQPDPAPRSYRLEILLERISEADAVELAEEIADTLAARGHAIHGDDHHVRSVIMLGHHEWREELVTDALHALLPRATPQPPDLEFYTPN